MVTATHDMQCSANDVGLVSTHGQPGKLAFESSNALFSFRRCVAEFSLQTRFDSPTRQPFAKWPPSRNGWGPLFRA